MEICAFNNFFKIVNQSQIKCRSTSEKRAFCISSRNLFAPCRNTNPKAKRAARIISARYLVARSRQ